MSGGSGRRLRSGVGVLTALCTAVAGCGSQKTPSSARVAGAGAGDPVSAVRTLYDEADGSAADRVTADANDPACPGNGVAGDRGDLSFFRLDKGEHLQFTAESKRGYTRVSVAVRTRDGGTSAVLDPVSVVEHEGRFFVC